MSDATRDTGNSGISAVLLAGGKGARLHPYTAVFPKPLMPLGDVPVLEVLLRRLKAFGLSDFTVCTGHLAELIRSFFGDGSKFGVQIRYTQEPEPLGTAGPIGLIEGLSDPFIVMNGDLLTTLDFGALLRCHREKNAQATIGVFPRDVKIDFGVLDVDGNGYLSNYREKPHFEFVVSMGVYVLNRSVLELLPRKQRFDMPDLITRVRERGGRVACFQSECYWLDIGRADDYAEAQRQIEANPQAFLATDVPK